MRISKQILVLCVLAVASAAIAAALSLPSVMGFSIQFMLTTLAITFVLAALATILFPIRHDLITLFVGLSSALVVIGKQPGVFSPFVFVIFFTVPYIGAAIGRDIRKVREQRKTGQQPA